MNHHADLFQEHRKYIISFSGGMGSGISALLAYEHNLDFELVFADTLIEDEDLYRFNDDIARAVGKKVVHLKDGRDPWQVFVDERFMGNSRLAHCSDELKTKVVAKWLEEQRFNAPVTMVLGMGLSEMDRIERAQKRWGTLPVLSFLAHYRVSRVQDMEAKLTQYGIRKPRLYDFGFPHNNCGGGCVRAGLKAWVTLLERMPERYAYHEFKQIETMAKIGPTAKPFLKRTVKGVKEYMTLTRFRELVQAGEIEINPFDYGGCGCFVD